MRHLIALAMVAGTIALTACASGSSSQDCIIVASSGARLCGTDAAAWCESTEAIRTSAGDPTYGYESATGVHQSRSTCDILRGG